MEDDAFLHHMMIFNTLKSLSRNICRPLLAFLYGYLQHYQYSSIHASLMSCCSIFPLFLVYDICINACMHVCMYVIIYSFHPLLISHFIWHVFLEQEPPGTKLWMPYYLTLKKEVKPLPLYLRESYQMKMKKKSKQHLPPHNLSSNELSDFSQIEVLQAVQCRSGQGMKDWALKMSPRPSSHPVIENF